MILVLLDTNAYLRLAKRIRPLLGVEFGQKQYSLTVLKQVEDEVFRSPRLQFLYPWFTEGDLSAERLAKQVRLSKEERTKIEAAASVLRAHVLRRLHQPGALASFANRLLYPRFRPSAARHRRNRRYRHAQARRRFRH